ncbi:MAG: cation:proton antiporter [Pseudomonadota bacterium]|nr:cation:proton antiporter [Pseudomonadota bacterium]
MHGLDFLSDLAVIFLVAIAVVIALGRLGIPPVVGFLVAGAVVGPGGLALVGDTAQVEVFAEVGVALLLFTIGLEFSLARLRHIARYVVIGGGLQVLLTVLAAGIGAAALGVRPGVGVFWGYLAALSSTAIVLRALADREETAAPHGRFIVGVLIFQDLCIVAMMLTLPMLAGTAGGVEAVVFTMAKAAAVVVGTLVLARKGVPALLERVAATNRRELFLLAVLSVAIVVAGITSSVGLSLALGAFLAGMVIADTDFVHQAENDVAPFRDTFASLFFVSIGMLLDPRVLMDSPMPVLGIFLVLVLGKFILATLAAMFMRFPARVAITAGVGLAQVGEFSFVLLGSGQELGLITAEGARVFLASSVLSMIVAPLAMASSPRIAAGAALLRPLERLLAVRRPADAEEAMPLVGHVVVAGLGAGGQFLLQALHAARVPYVGIDLDPEAIDEARSAGHPVQYGDIASVEVLTRVAHVGGARLLVLMLSDAQSGRRAAMAARRLYPELPILVRSHRLRRVGAPIPGVEFVAEDYETAVEIAERALRRFGATGDAVRAAIAASRAARDSDGKPVIGASALMEALALDSFAVEDGGRLAGRTVAACGLREETGATIVAVARDQGVVTNPGPTHVLEVGETIFVIGTAAQLDRVGEWMRGVAA